jgi:GNAT superfamily N-acetyltransferase
MSALVLERIEPAGRANERWRVKNGDAGDAACSLWWSPVRMLAGQRFGCIGEYGASSPEAAAALLAHACVRLIDSGCALAVGPMDGSTWHNYRFVTEPGTESTFFLEPENAATAPLQFRDAGFAPLAHYVSALDRGLEIRDENAAVAERRLTKAGVRIRTLDSARFADEARAIYRVSMASFKENFLYAPIDEAEFIATYTPVEQYVDPDIAFVAERRGCAVGFVFALPDWLGRRCGAHETAVIKTLARLPDSDFRGLGAVLLEHCRRSAFERGYVRGIHALMHESNASIALSGRFGSVMRGYTLYARSL